MCELGQEALAELDHGFHIPFKLISSELAGTSIFHNLLYLNRTGDTGQLPSKRLQPQ